jgi:hypothetical protein
MTSDSLKGIGLSDEKKNGKNSQISIASRQKECRDERRLRTALVLRKNRWDGIVLQAYRPWF